MNESQQIMICGHVAALKHLGRENLMDWLLCTENELG